MDFSELIKYIESNVSEEQKELLASWIVDPSKQNRVEDNLCRIWRDTDPGRVQPRTALHTILERIHRKIGYSPK